MALLSECFLDIVPLKKADAESIYVVNKSLIHLSSVSKTKIFRLAIL